MKDKILEISDKLRKDVITIEEAESLLLGLFGVSGSYSKEEIEQITHDAHNGLPDDCIKGWDEVKFCEVRNGDGGGCKWCSNYR